MSEYYKVVEELQGGGFGSIGLIHGQPYWVRYMPNNETVAPAESLGHDPRQKALNPANYVGTLPAQAAESVQGKWRNAAAACPLGLW